jgi:hypothetical protein
LVEDVVRVAKIKGTLLLDAIIGVVVHWWLFSNDSCIRIIDGRILVVSTICGYTCEELLLLM